MNFFSNIFRTPEPPPTPELIVADPEQLLLEQLAAANVALDSHTEAMRTFRTRNFGFVDGRMITRGTDVLEAAQAREHWNQLLRQLTVLQAERSRILKAWSELKTR